MAEAAVQSTGVNQKTLGEKSIPLKREMGWGAVFIFVLSSIGLTYSGMFPFSTIAGMYPGTNLFGVVTVGAVLALILAYVYAVIGSIAPQYGADYLVTSRVLHPALAFATSLTLVTFFCIAGGSLVASIAQETLPMFAQILSIVSTDRSLVGLVETLITPNGVVLTGSIGMVIIFLMLILPPRATRTALTAGFVLTLIGWGVLAFQLVSAPVGSFQNSYDALMGQGRLIEHIESARGLGMLLNFSIGPIISAGSLMGLWIFYGYYYPTLFAGEVKRPQRSLLIGSWGAIGAAWVLLGLITVLVWRQIPVEWMTAESFLNLSTSYREPTMPWLPFYAAVLRPIPALVWLVGLVWLYTLLNLAHTFLYTASRVVFAWAEDRLLPESVTFVHPVLRSPVVAVLLVCLLALLGVIFAALNGSILFQFSTLFFMVVVQVPPVLAVSLLPILKPDWFASGSKIVSAKIGRVPVVTVVGGLSLLYLIGMTVANYIYRLFGNVDLPTILMFGVIFLAGLGWFYLRRHLIKNQGGDLDAWLKKLPEK